jgi:outer membrane protein assembly factor BamB
VPIPYRRVMLPGFALAMLAGLAGCSSAPSPAASLATAVAACQRATPARLPAAAGQQPGDIRWSVSLGRCTRDSGQTWSPSGLTSPTTWATPAPGGRLAVLAGGAVSMFNTATGARLWRREVAPGGKAAFETLDATQSLVMVQFRTVKNTVSTFLDAGSGQPVGKMNAVLSGEPFLVGKSVVVSDRRTTLAGYDPATGLTRWRATVPDAPTAGAEVNDGTTVYLNSGASSENAAPMRRIDRLDAATGQLLAPLTLNQALGFDLSAEGGNDFAQGLLLLGVSSPSTQTVAVDPRSGAVKWTYPGDVVSEGGLFTYFDQGSNELTAISPGTGRAAWNLQQSGLNTEGGPQVLLATPGYAVAWSPAAAERWVVTGIRPGGGTAWSSTRFPGAVFLANDASTVYVIGCTPGKQPGVCADLTLAAVAA